jgi:hypothetical protein
MAEDKNVFIHHVFFWLADPNNAGHRQQLIEGLKKLSKVTFIKRFHIGQPGGTSRDVVDASYSLSWCLFFSSLADQDSYQIDPIHIHFLKECKHLWKRVLVYDSIDA